MLARFALFCLATLIVFGLRPGRSNAQGLYYRSIPIGERAIGMAGAYTGIADDPSATYYNPAGLMAGGRFALLGSLSSIVYTKKKIENAVQVDSEARDLDSTRTTTLPHFIGTVVKVGKQAFGDKRYALAFSSFELERGGFNESFSEIGPSGSVDLRISEGYRMRWWGFSSAMQWRENVSFGISVFLSNQSYGYRDDLGLASGGTLDENGLRTGGSSVTSGTSIGMQSWHLVFRLGALYRINPQWQIGFMFQPPGAPLKSTGSIFRTLDSNLAGAESEYFLFDEGGFQTKQPIPFTLRVGVEYKINALTVLSVDGAVTGPVRDQEIFDVPDNVDAVVSNLGIYFANSTARRCTPNFAIGAEHLFGKVVIAGGLFTNLSAAPNVPASSTTYTPDQVSMFGASLAIGLDTKGYRLTLGGTGYFGRGEALAFTVDREAQVSFYQRTKSNISAVVVYVAGALSVASKGAKQVQEKYQEKKAKKQNGDADTDSDADADTDPVE